MAMSALDLDPLVAGVQITFSRILIVIAMDTLDVKIVWPDTVIAELLATHLNVIAKI